MSESAVRESKDSIKQQLARLLEGMGAEIRELEAQLAKARQDRRELERALNALEGRQPNAARSKTNGKADPRGATTRVSDETVREVHEWLTEHRDELGETFSLPDIVGHPEFPRTKTTARAAVILLHERGVLRLDHVGGVGIGTARQRFYALS